MLILIKKKTPPKRGFLSIVIFDKLGIELAVDDVFPDEREGVRLEPVRTELEAVLPIAPAILVLQIICGPPVQVFKLELNFRLPYVPEFMEDPDYDVNENPYVFIGHIFELLV